MIAMLMLWLGWVEEDELVVVGEVAWKFGRARHFLGGRTSFSGLGSGIQSYNKRVYHPNDDCFL
jgi:hypothetical protein